MAFDPMYYLFALPALIISGIAQMLVKSRFAKYSKVAARSRMTGADAARHLLQRAGVTNVRIERIQGALTDHYDPTAHVLRLSEPVYGVASIAAIGVACHEAGHALQHAESYAPLKLRSALVPAVNIGSKFGIILIIAGAVLNAAFLTYVGAAASSIGTLLYYLVRLGLIGGNGRRRN